MNSNKNRLGKILFKKIFIWYISVAALLTVLQIYKEYADNKNNLFHSFTTIEKIFTGATSSAVWNLDEEQINYNAKAMSDMDNILGVLVLDPENLILAQFGTVDESSKKYTQYVYKKEKVKYQAEMLQHSFDLIHTDNSSKTLGRVSLYSSDDVVYLAMQENVLFIIINSMIKSFVLMLLFLFFTNKIITQSLHQLTKAINSLSINSYEKISADDTDVLGEHEIGILVKSYNDMRDRIHNEMKKNANLKERVELALMGSNSGVWDWNMIDNTMYFSPRWKEMLGYTDDELPNEIPTWEERLHPDDLNKTWEDVEKNIIGETKFYQNIHRLKHKNGSWVWILDLGKTLYNQEGKAIRMIGTHTDITKDKEIQLKLAHQAQVINQIHDAVISTDLNGIITSWNKGAELMLGYTATDILGQHIAVIHLNKDHKAVQKSMDRLQVENAFHDEVKFVKKSKSTVITELSLSTLRNEDENIIGYIGYAHDISKRKKAESLLHFQAYHDALTQLPNRALFNDRLKQTIEKAKRDKETFALFFIDLDKFKEINDSLGHEIGDKVLEVVAQRLKDEIRTEDTLARLGGDEFTVIMQNISYEKDASLLAQKIVTVMQEAIIVDKHTLYVTSSVGISIYPSDGTDSVDLLRYADIAMYKAKEKGRNNFQFYKN